MTINEKIASPQYLSETQENFLLYRASCNGEFSPNLSWERLCLFVKEWAEPSRKIGWDCVKFIDATLRIRSLRAFRAKNLVTRGGHFEVVWWRERKMARRKSLNYVKKSPAINLLLNVDHSRLFPCRWREEWADSLKPLLIIAIYDHSFGKTVELCDGKLAKIYDIETVALVRSRIFARLNELAMNIKLFNKNIWFEPKIWASQKWGGMENSVSKVGKLRP